MSKLGKDGWPSDASVIKQRDLEISRFTAELAQARIEIANRAHLEQETAKQRDQAREELREARETIDIVNDVVRDAEAKNLELAAQVAVLVAKLKQVDSHFNLPAEAEKLMRVVEAARLWYDDLYISTDNAKRLRKAIRDLQGDKP